MRKTIVMKRVMALVLFVLLGAAPAFSAEWTIMVYLDGDNNLEGAGVDDINEMEQVGSTAETNVVVQFDRISGYDVSNGDWTDTRRGKITADTTTQIASNLVSIGEKNMGDKATLREFALWAMAQYPAEHYLLVLWNHGDGWRTRIEQLRSQLSVVNEKMLRDGPTPPLTQEAARLDKKIAEVTKAICWDDTDGGDALTIAECREVLEGISPKIDIIGFDACLMAMTEIAYEMKDGAEYMVASEQLEPDDGWPYDSILTTLRATPAMASAELAAQIVYLYGQSYGGQETLSAVWLAKMATLASALDNLSALLIAQTTDWETIEAARAASSNFYDRDYRDLKAFLEALASGGGVNQAIGSALQAALTAFDQALVRNHSGPSEGANGLSIELIDLGGTFPADYSASNLRFAAATQWDELLREMSEHRPPDDVYEPNDSSAQATPLGLGEYPSLRSENEDWYRVSVPGGTAFMAMISFNHSVGDLDLDLYASDLTVMDRSDSVTGTECVYVQAENAEEYLVRVYGYGGASNRYDLSLFTPAADTAYTWQPASMEWIEATDGTFLEMGDDDYTSAPIGFDFQFYGVTYSGIKISSNGYLTFGYVGDAYTNQPLPLKGEPSNLIAPFWDDLTPNTGNGVYFKLVGSAPNRKLVVQWDDVPHYSHSTTGGITFQAILEESTNEITFQYRDVSFGDLNFDSGKSATVGIENSAGTAGTLYSYKRAGLSDGVALVFRPRSASNLLTIQGVAAELTDIARVGQPFTVRVTAGGTPESVYYRFWKAKGFQTKDYGAWQLLRDWGSDASISWAPDADDHYMIVGWVSADPTGQEYSQAGISVETAGNRAHPIQVTGLTAQQGFSSGGGNTITLNTTAIGGDGQLQYLYWVGKGAVSEWTMVRGYAPNPRCTWSPEEGGAYTILVWVTDDPSGSHYAVAGMSYALGE
jgi:hypothetical protein